MTARQEPPPTAPPAPRTQGRAAWFLTALGAATATYVVHRLPPGLLRPGSPAAPLCGALAALALAGGAVPRWRTPLGAALACVRLALALVLDLAWAPDHHEVWAALAVYVALQDAERRTVPRHPLLPAAVAIVVAIAWTGTTRQVAPARAVLVGLVAAAAAAWGAERAAAERAP